MKLKIKVKSHSGFTFADVVVSIVVIVLFLGTIAGLYSQIATMTQEIKLKVVASNYAVQVAEKIDKMSYEEVIEGIDNYLKAELRMPDTYLPSISVEKYSEITSGQKQDIIKIVTIRVAYPYKETPQEVVIQKLKIKE